MSEEVPELTDLATRIIQKVEEILELSREADAVYAEFMEWWARFGGGSPSGINAQVDHCAADGKIGLSCVARIIYTTGGLPPFLREGPSQFCDEPEETWDLYKITVDGTVYASVANVYHSSNRQDNDPEVWYEIDGYCIHEGTTRIDEASIRFTAVSGWIHAGGVQCLSLGRPDDALEIYVGEDWFQFLTSGDYVTVVCDMLGVDPCDDVPDYFSEFPSALTIHEFGELEIYYDADRGEYWFDGDQDAVILAYSLLFGYNWGWDLTDPNAPVIEDGNGTFRGHHHNVCPYEGSPEGSNRPWIDDPCVTLPYSVLSASGILLGDASNDYNRSVTALRDCLIRNTGRNSVTCFEGIDVTALAVDSASLSVSEIPEDRLSGYSVNSGAWDEIGTGDLAVNVAGTVDPSSTGETQWGDKSFGEYPHVAIVVGWADRNDNWQSGEVELFPTLEDAQIISGKPSDVFIPYVIDRGWRYPILRGPRPFDEYPISSTNAGQVYYTTESFEFWILE